MPDYALRIFAMFSMFIKLAIFINIATLKRPLCHLVSFVTKTSTKFRHFHQIGHNRKNRHFERGSFAISFEF